MDVFDTFVLPLLQQRDQGKADDAHHQSGHTDLSEDSGINVNGLQRNWNARITVGGFDGREFGDQSCQVVAEGSTQEPVPMTVDTIRAGASRVTMESPTGERQSSPVVCSM